jgi:hypothetical protein
MKAKSLWVFLSFLIAVCSSAAGLVEAPLTCKQCGMNRQMFAYGRMLINYADGSTVGLCSLYCAAVELKNSAGKSHASLLVADYYSRELLDARSASWVMGGRKSGVMTVIPKWAFARVEDARKFIAAYGGTPGTFDQAMTATTREIQERQDEEKFVEKEMLRETQ